MITISYTDLCVVITIVRTVQHFSHSDLSCDYNIQLLKTQSCEYSTTPRWLMSEVVTPWPSQMVQLPFPRAPQCLLHPLKQWTKQEKQHHNITTTWHHHPKIILYQQEPEKVPQDPEEVPQGDSQSLTWYNEAPPPHDPYTQVVIVHFSTSCPGQEKYRWWTKPLGYIVEVYTAQPEQ